MKIVLCIISSILCTVGQVHALQYQFPVVNLEIPENSICPPASELEAVRMDIANNVSHILQEIAAGYTTTHTAPECGSSGWRRVAFLNMTDPNQQCPDSWRQYSQNSVRVCGRQVNSTASCDSVEYSADGLEYTHVCGKIIGFEYNTPDGYTASHDSIELTPGNEINEPYVDGVSVTYGYPRQHLWTLYGSGNENYCCLPPFRSSEPPSFIEQNYFCDTGGDHEGYPLWDNETNCPHYDNCCAPHAGPWFNTMLTAPTIEHIEIRICGDESTSNEDTPLELIEIYVM